jgi:hypothetical protein
MRKYLLGLSLFGILILGGCGEDNETPKYRQLDGRVSKIDQATGTVEMNWYNDKMKKEVSITGKLAPDAEILINGMTARLEDVHVDDAVKVTGRIEKAPSGERQVVATKVEVTRPELTPSTHPAATKPASQQP